MTFINIFTNTIKQKRFIACITSAVLTGFICYIYCLVNNLNNYDSISNTPYGVGATASSGRWMLYYIQLFTQKFYYTYHLRFLYGILAIIIYAIASYIIVETFKIDDLFLCIAISSITVAFPAVGSSMYFTYCVHFYALAFLLVVFCIRFIAKGTLISYVISIVLLAMSIGIYQAFFPLAAALAIAYVAILALDSDVNVVFKKGIFAGGSIILGYVINSLLSKLTLLITGISLSDYRSISSMGGALLSELPKRLAWTYRAFFLPFATSGFMGVTNPLMNKGFLLLFYITVFVLFVILLKAKENRKQVITALALILVLMPPASLFFYIILPKSEIYSIMMFPTMIIFYLPCFLISRAKFDDKTKKSFIAIFGVLILLISSNYAFLENVNYNALYYSNRKVENYLTMMFAQIRATEGYSTDKPITFIGEHINDPTFQDNWKLENYVLGGYCPAVEQLNVYSRSFYLMNYLGMSYTTISAEQKEKYADIIEDMATYPNYGSIYVTDECILVNLK
ncbi:MAG: glucosyltransferase domain-containing protein [Lachnospiraceae bacterium]|nr:glucosyltransferase domain-containing protein [Lachnospiraceae bacterium]